MPTYRCTAPTCGFTANSVELGKHHKEQTGHTLEMIGKQNQVSQTVPASYQKLYSPKRTSTQTVGLVFTILGAPLLLAYGFGAIFLAPGILLWYYGRAKCPHCQTRSKMYVANTEVSQEHGFGMVTRNDIVRGRVGKYRQTSNVQRQERVPVVKTVTRVDYKCANCQQFVGSKDFYSQQEDFGPTPSERTVIQKEVLRIPCRYCKTLLDPIREKTCPHCGSVVST